MNCLDKLIGCLDNHIDSIDKRIAKDKYAKVKELKNKPGYSLDTTKPFYLFEDPNIQETIPYSSVKKRVSKMVLSAANSYELFRISQLADLIKTEFNYKRTFRQSFRNLATKGLFLKVTHDLWLRNYVVQGQLEDKDNDQLDIIANVDVFKKVIKCDPIPAVWKEADLYELKKQDVPVKRGNNYSAYPLDGNRNVQTFTTDLYWVVKP